MSNRPIGIFDSGVGGLTVLRAIRKLLPSENIVYFGDTARVPYGNKSRPTIIRFSRESANFLKKKKAKIIVAACNTSSALALGSLRKSFRVPVLGVIEAGVRRAVELTRNKKIGVIGTKSTIRSKSYQRMILSKNNNVRVYSQACPLFVPLVEEGILSGEIVRRTMDLYLKGLKKKGVDVVILGCTHYPLLKRELTSYFKGVSIVDSAKEVASYVKKALVFEGMINCQKGNSRVEFYISDEPEGFIRLTRLFLKKDIPKPQVVNPVRD